MATAIVNAIGIGSAILTTVGFLQSNIAGNAPPEGSTVKIKGTRSTMTPFTTQSNPRMSLTCSLAGLPGLTDEGASLVSLLTSQASQ
jgi:hypothetical protein